MKLSEKLILNLAIPDKEVTSDLLKYVSKQLSNVIPIEEHDVDIERMSSVIEAVCDRLDEILISVRYFTSHQFDILNTHQYSSFLYLLANELYKKYGKIRLCEKLFILNKALNGLNLYYEVQLPRIFFLNHPVGTVLGNASYSNCLVVYQNVTVGGIGKRKPNFGKNVILFPGAKVVGGSVIGDNCVIGANVLVNDSVVKEGMVLEMRDGKVIKRVNSENYINLYYENNR